MFLPSRLTMSVALHDVLALDGELADAFLVGVEGGHFDERQDLAAGAAAGGLVVGGEADDGGAFGQAVALAGVEAELLVVFEDGGVDGGAAGDDQADAAAQVVEDLLADGRAEAHLPEEPAGLVGAEGGHDLVAHLFEEERDGEEGRGVGLADVFRDGAEGLDEGNLDSDVPFGLC